MLFPSTRKIPCSLVFVVTLLSLGANTPKTAAQDKVIGQPASTSAIVKGGSDGVSQPSTSVAIVVDQSSAARYKTDELRKAVSDFMQAFTSEDEACVYIAGQKPTLVRDFTADASLIAQSLRNSKPNGKLVLYDSIAAALDHLRSDAANEKAAVVVFSAGEDAASSTNVPALEQKLKASQGVALYAIAAPGGSLRWQSSLQQLAVASGGRAFFPSRNAQLKEASALAAQGVFGRAAVQAAENSAPDSKPLARYKSIVVRSIPLVESRNTSAAQGGENILLHDLLVARLQKSKLFPEVVDAGNTESSQAAVASAPSTPGTTLELLATLVTFEHGSRLSWKFLGSGGTRMKVQVVLRDAATQQPVLSLVQEGSAVSGLLSGGEEGVRSKAVLHAVNGIIAQIRKAK